MSEQQEEHKLDNETDIGAYLTVMVKHDSSDLFLHTGAKPTIKGNFGFKTLGTELKHGDTEAMLRSMLPDSKMSLFETQGEVDFSFSISKVGRFRGNAFRQRGDISIVMRHVKGDIPTIESLGLPEVLKKLVEQKYGMIVISGATGSGKSTSLAAMIDHRNSSQAGHIITLEDPIEFMHVHKKSLVAQREIGTDTESFETGMRAAMREAPNVILMGEIRDKVSMEYAVKFANTGHLCLSTIHANTAVSSLERMLSFFDPENQAQEAKRLAQNLRAIICQRLIPSSDGSKVAVLEILINTPRMSDLIAKLDYGAMKETIAQGVNYGMQTFDQAICRVFDQELIDKTSAIENADSKTHVSQHILYNSPRSKKPENVDTLSVQNIDDDDPTNSGGVTF